jgi:SOS-response transcriptional repressor LexA
MTETLIPTRTARSRKQAALEFIRRHFRDRGGSPSYAEIASAIGATPQRVAAIVADLEEDGEILRRHGAARSIRLPEPADELADSEIELILRRRGFIMPPIEVDENGTAPSLTERLNAIIARAGDQDDEHRHGRQSVVHPAHGGAADA